MLKIITVLNILLYTHQTADRIATSDRAMNNAIFDNLSMLRKYFAEIDGVRYPRDEVILDYGKNQYLDQYRDLKMFYKEYVGEPILKPFYILS